MPAATAVRCCVIVCVVSRRHVKRVRRLIDGRLVTPPVEGAGHIPCRQMVRPSIVIVASITKAVLLVTNSSNFFHLAVALDGTGWHPAAWRAADARPDAVFGPQYWVDLVTEAERASLDFVTIEDSLT